MKKFLTLILVALSMVPAFGQIKADQILQISITGVPVSEKARLDNTYPVSSSGMINMWMIGSLKAAGLTKDQLAARIAEKYKAAGIYNNPNFIVNSNVGAGDIQKTFTVGGQVRSPGPKQWTKGVTLYAAVQAAGGSTAYGALNRVKLYRNGQVYTYNLKVDKHKTVKIYDKDTIDVPQQKWNGK